MADTLQKQEFTFLNIRKTLIMSVQFYAKVFGIGTILGAGMEALLIQSNYYQMLAASEAKARMKKQQEELEDIERFQTMSQNNPDK